MKKTSPPLFSFLLARASACLLLACGLLPLAIHSALAETPAVILEGAQAQLDKVGQSRDHLLDTWLVGGTATWETNIPAAGKYHVLMEFRCEENQGGHCTVTFGGQGFLFEVRGTGDEAGGFKRYSFGTFDLPAGPLNVRVIAGEFLGKKYMNLKSLSFVPAGQAVATKNLAEPMKDVAVISPSAPTKTVEQIDSYKPIEGRDFRSGQEASIVSDNNLRYLTLHGSKSKEAWACFPDVSLAMGRTKLKLRYSAGTPASFSLRLDSPQGPVIATASLAGTQGAWKELAMNVHDANERHHLYLTSDAPLNIDYFTFVPNKNDYKAAIDFSIDRMDLKKAGRGPGGENGWAVFPQMYEATKDPRYLKAAVAIARNIIADYRKGETPKQIYGRGGFLAHRPWMLLTEFVLAQGDLTPDEKEILRKVAEDFVLNGTYDAGNVMNRSMGYYLGVPPTLRLFPDIAVHDQLVEYRDRAVKQFLQIKQPLENSAGYETINYFYLPKMIDDFDLQYLFQDPGMKHVFMDFKNSIYPSGVRPMFGDYGGMFVGGSVQYVSALERIAAEYKDGEAKTLAHRMIGHSVLNKSPSLTKPWDDGMGMDAVVNAYLHGDDNVAESELQGGVVLNVRLTGHLDKVLFKSNGTPASFNATFDLINGGEHSDNDALSLNNVAKGERAYLYDVAGRNEANHSRPLIRDSLAEVPRPAPNKQGWQFVCLDLQRHWTFDNIAAFKNGKTRFRGGGYFTSPIIPEEYAYDPAKEFLFAMTGSGKLNKPAKFSIAEMTLEKGNGEKKILEDFSKAEGWKGRDFQVVTDPETGRKSGQFTAVPDPKGPQFGKIFPMPLDIDGRDYDRLSFWFKAEGADNDFALKDTSFTIGEKQMYPRNYLMHHNPVYKVAADYVTDGDPAAFGSFTLDERDYRGEPLMRRRQCLFVKNELMWVRDVFDLKADPKRTAAVTWRFDRLQQNGDWFLTGDQGEGVLFMVPRLDMEIGHKTDLVNNIAFSKTPEVNKEVAYQASINGTGKSAPVRYFDSLFIPLDPGQDAAKVASSIRVEHDKEGVTLLSVGKDLLLMMNPTGGKVSAGRISTDCAQLSVRFLDSKLASVCGTKGSVIQVDGQTIVSSEAKTGKSDVLQKTLLPIPSLKGEIAPSEKVTKDGVTYVPLRLAADRLDFTADWNDLSKTLTMTRNSLVMNFREGSKFAWVNGHEWQLPSPVTLIGKELMISESTWEALRSEKYYP